MKNAVCMFCNVTYIVGKGAAAKYCTQQCSATHRTQMAVEKWLAGEDRGWSGKTVQLKIFIRKYLKDTRGSACSRCGWDEKHPVDGKSLTEIDHIDGDAHNCKPDNLRVLCPNCHSMTDTHRARNKNSKRNRRIA